MMDYVRGDLNGDKLEDAILILKTPGEDSSFDDSLKRPFLILLRQANGKLKQVKRNDEMILCRHCGGVFGDPYENTEHTKNGFYINFYGGSNYRWGYLYEFSYNAAKKNWLLTKEVQTSYRTTDPKLNIKEITIKADELLETTVDDFNANPPYDGSKWKVTAAKTFFYDSPGLQNKPRKGFLLKGDELTVIREFRNFVEVSFTNTKEQTTIGYLLKKDLSKIQ